MTMHPEITSGGVRGTCSVTYKDGGRCGCYGQFTAQRSPEQFARDNKPAPRRKRRHRDD